ncbi:hypothetical protein GPECTOR_5g131 [Gonium pectorale]|uniref:ABM domain-containing protein n=1 Tax=Gonium pectorale TaxID=33097 RepID=A0A150GW00_GONPE|nr:hypothetical protein GPECTOR_5g131 [Gonium pectorale]|eukprot:KXZ54021.1 hypothetical protein GPECTOR_5g131 [Gonium pectorale]
MAPTRRLLLAAAAAVLLLGVANAARYPSIKDQLLRRGGKDTPTIMAIKYEVPPSLHDKFEDVWLTYEKDLRKAGGITFYQLTKLMTDNVYFVGYTEWESWGDMMDHLDDFTSFLDDNDITREAFPLEAIGDIKREYRAGRQGAAPVDRRRRRTTDDPRDMPAHVLIKFNVPPHLHKDFIDVFMKVQEDVVQEEKENRFYTLREYTTTSHRYVIRAGWDTLDAYLDHMHPGPIKEFCMKNDVEFFIEPFRVLASSDEDM